MQVSIPRVYPITDVVLSGRSHVRQVELFAAGGAKMIQLRDKSAGAAEFYKAAVKSIEFARPRGIRIIINDRVDIALACGADGVHVGQNDFPPELARQLLGPERIIGFSTHSREQAMSADQSVDYIAFGPIFVTSTKENPDPTVGVDQLSELKARINKPLVAIGGITLSSAQRIISAGADSVAVISDLFVASNVSARVREFIDALG